MHAQRPYSRAATDPNQTFAATFRVEDANNTAIFQILSTGDRPDKTYPEILVHVTKRGDGWADVAVKDARIMQNR